MLKRSLSVICSLAIVWLPACSSSSDETSDELIEEPGTAPAGGGAGGAGPTDNETGLPKLSCDDADVLCYDFGPIDVEPGSEWQGFQAFAVENTEDRAIVGLEVDQVGATSHHFIIAPWSGETAPPLEGPYDLFSDDGLQFVGDALGGIVAGSVYKYVNISTGDYIGVKIPTNAYLVNNGHYLNASSEPAAGLTRVKIKTVPASEVDFLAIEAQPGTSDINVAPGEQETVGATWIPPHDVAVTLMTSHMHRHGVLFEAWSNIDGVETKIYSTTNYDAPPLKIFSGGDQGDPPLVLRPDRGDYMRFECTHVNDDLSVPLTYGPFADTSEMCIMPVYYVGEPDRLLELMEAANGEGGFGWEYIPYGG